MPSKPVLAAVGAIAAVGTLAGTAAAVHATPAPARHAAATEQPTNGIIAGDRAPSTPWMVQLHLGDDRQWQECSGELISSEWVLTARHCIEGDGDMSVYFSNSTRNLGEPTRGDRLIAAPRGDIALVHLETPHEIDEYPMLAIDYRPTEGDEGRIMGYGLRGDRVRSTGLFQADVDVLGADRDLFGGESVHIKGVNGAANHGDSGGPLVVDGKIVAVCSMGELDDPGHDAQSGSYYANLGQATSWIRRTTGL